MGGAKRMSLKQAEKRQSMRSQKQADQRRKRQEAHLDKKRGEIFIPDLNSKQVLQDLSKIKAITSYAVASKYDVRLSAAKNMLEVLEKRGILQQVASNNNIKLYRYRG